MFVIGRLIARWLSQAVAKAMSKTKVEKTLIKFVTNLVYITLLVFVIIAALGVMGIETASFAVVLGAAGLAVGLALSGTLQNFSGGVMVLIFRPFKKGDFIEAQGYSGIVDEIQIFNTILKTPDNKTIILPNGSLSTSQLTNYSTEKFRRVDMTFGIGYGESIEHAKSVLFKIIDNDKRVLYEPAPPFVEVSELGDNSVNFAVRLWGESSDYWGVFFSMNENVYNEFNKEKISIPYPQMDVHLINEK